MWGPQNLTKRVIGVPGDLIEGRIEDGKPVIYRNGTKLDEPYLNQYPLIAAYTDYPSKIATNVKNEAINLLSQGQLSRAQFEQYINNRVGREINHRSYDPSVSFDKQPFYRLDEALLYKSSGQPLVTQPQTLIAHPKQGDTAPEGNEHYFDGTDVFRVKLKDNQYWIMGDNRLNSHDSRMFGPIDGRLIHGRILFRIMSIDSNDDWQILDLLKHPIDFWSRVRWNRFLQWIG